MNCIFILLLLSCCGNNGGCGCGCDRGRGITERDCDDRHGHHGRGERRPSGPDCGCGERRPAGPDCGCEERRPAGPDCGCEERRFPGPKPDRDCAREGAREMREEQQERSCDISDMIPPPWKDYPPMPKHDDCDCE